MSQYGIEIEVTANRLPEPFAVQAMDVGSPVRDVSAMAKEMGKMMRAVAPGPHAPGLMDAGVAMKRVIVVRAESFAALAEILAKFDHLAEEIECSHPAE